MFMKKIPTILSRASIYTIYNNGLFPFH